MELSNYEYQKLLLEVKKDLGLPSDYRRKPHRYGKYVKDSYFIKRYDSSVNDFEVITYSPTREDIENKLEILNDGVSIYKIEQATDEHMKELIKDDYFHKDLLWNEILKKYQLPYMKFLELLNEIKKELGLTGDVRTAKDTRYIYKYNRTGKYVIRKNLNGKPVGFGYYPDMATAIRVRDYLEKIFWDVARWNEEKLTVVEKLE